MHFIRAQVCALATNPARMHRSMNAAIQPAHGRTRAERHAGPPVATGTCGRPPPASIVRANTEASSGVLRCPAVCWSREFGLRLACASSDENIAVLTYLGEHSPGQGQVCYAIHSAIHSAFPSPHAHISFTRSPRPSTSSRGSLAPPASSLRTLWTLGSGPRR